jgi:hypothetical protein
MTELRRMCVTALGELGHHGSLRVLASLLGDGDRRLAELAATSLLRMGSEGIARLENAAATTPQSPGGRAAGGALGLARLRGLIVTQSGSS